MNILWLKWRRDLRADLIRLTLMVVAIAVALTVFGAMVITRSVASRESVDAYLSTQPASATLVFDRPLDASSMESALARARAVDGVGAAVGRAQFTGEVHTPAGLLANPLQVFVAAPTDPLELAGFRVENGVWPPASNEVLLLGDSLDLLGVGIGDPITVAGPGGVPIALRVAGTVYDPSLSPSAQEQLGRAYLSTAALGRSEVFDQLKIQVDDTGTSVATRDRDRIVAVASEVGATLTASGVAVREIQVPTPYAHPHQWQADALLTALVIGGALAVLLSAVLVASMLNGLFTRQIPQIGILKAIGASSGAVAGPYLAMTFLVAGTATLLALPLALLGGRALSAMMLGLLGIDAASLAPSVASVVVVLGMGLLPAPLLTLVPLIRTSRTTVRAAIDHHGAATKPGPLAALLARITRWRRLDRGFVLALRNTLRRPARFWLSVGLLATAATVFVTGLSLNAGLAAVTDQQVSERDWDVDIALAAPMPVGRVDAVLASVPGVVRSEGWRQLKAGLAGPEGIPVTRTYPDQGHGSVSITAIPAGSRMSAAPDLLEGRELADGELGKIVLNQVVRDNSLPGVHAGDTVTVFTGGAVTRWEVAGIVEERMHGSAVYATDAGLAAALGVEPLTNQVRVVTSEHDESARDRVADLARTVLRDSGIEVSSAASVSRRETVSGGHLGPLIAIIGVIAIALAVIGVIGLSSTMSANVVDRTREFGVMHALGAAPASVRWIVRGEGALLVIAGCLAAIVPALVTTRILGDGLGRLFLAAPLPYRISLPAIGIWLVLALLAGLLATDAAASRAARISVREALSY